MKSIFFSVLMFQAILSLRAYGETDPLYRQMMEAVPDGRFLPVANLSINKGAFTLSLVSGELLLMPPIEGREWGALFSGEGVITVNPGSEREKAFMRFLTKKGDQANFGFKRMFLLFTDRTFHELSQGKSPATGEAKGGGLLKKFRHFQSEIIGRNFYFRVLRDHYNSPEPEGGVFIAMLDGGRFENAVAIRDPKGLETTFPGTRMGGNHSVFWVMDHHDGGIWFLDRARNLSPRKEGPKLLTDAHHYKIDTTVDGKMIEGRAEIGFEPVNPGQRFLTLQLMSRLALKSAVLFEEGQREPSICALAQELQKGAWDSQGRLGTAVISPQPLEPGKRYKLVLDYEGDDVVLHDGFHHYYVLSRTTWYPNLGTFGDRATFDLTFDYPKRLELLSVGELVSSRTEGKRKIDRWKSDQPLTVAGFNYGRFQRFQETDEISGLELEVHSFFDTDPEPSADVLADMLNSARLFHTYFGPLPFKKIKATQQSAWTFGQAWPTLLYMPTFSFKPAEVQYWQSEGMKISEFVEHVGAHELAHQWWGHCVTARTFADQWIEEGFAEFSANLFLQQTLGWDELRQVLKTTRKEIGEHDVMSRIKYYEMGPISLGYRLSNARTPLAYQRLIYGKGGFVVHMLRMMMMDPRSADPDRRFIAMMKDFTETHGGGTVTSHDFQTTVERHMLPKMNATGDGRMNWFFDQWVHGTELPVYHCQVTAKHLGELNFELEGTISQDGVSDDFRMMVPVYARFKKDRFLKLTDLPFKGVMTHNIKTKVRFPEAPEEILVNANYDVLSRDGG